MASSEQSHSSLVSRVPRLGISFGLADPRTIAVRQESTRLLKFVMPIQVKSAEKPIITG